MAVILHCIIDSANVNPANYQQLQDMSNCDKFILYLSSSALKRRQNGSKIGQNQFAPIECVVATFLSLSL